MEKDMARIAAKVQVDIGIDCWMDEEPTPMDGNICALIEAACRETG